MDFLCSASDTLKDNLTITVSTCAPLNAQQAVEIFKMVVVEAGAWTLFQMT